MLKNILRLPTVVSHFLKMNGLHACKIELDVSTKSVVESTIKKMLSERAEAQPLGQLSCGSVFRNPPDDHAAILIESCGLKGKKCRRCICIREACQFYN